ncbi:MAG: exosortase/archaeosortase family protein [Candidatus Omnitrophica bacterium]|nr:exosortase/archaeosortase family protein [Candidatus Omnitrophota bacterium]
MSFLGGTTAPGRFIVWPLWAGLFLFLFWPTFLWMAERFESADSFYSHGWLIPFASIWLVWRRREQLKNIPRAPSFAGLFLLVPAVVVHLAATLLSIGVVSGFAMLAALYGLVWVLCGRRMLWELRFPLLFLLFMVPLPGVTLIALSFRMKILAASMAAGVIRMMGIPVAQAGSMLHVPGVSVIVDDTCSGLRSLISLIALSTLWTALLPAGSQRWKKAAIVVASIPIALGANMIRIIALVLLSAIYGPYIAESFIHYGSGFVVFGVALAALAWLSKAMEKWSLPSFVLHR